MTPQDVNATIDDIIIVLEENAKIATPENLALLTDLSSILKQSGIKTDVLDALVDFETRLPTDRILHLLNRLKTRRIALRVIAKILS